MGMADNGASVATGWAKMLEAVISPPKLVVSGVGGNVEAVGSVVVGVGIVPVKRGWSVMCPQGLNDGIYPGLGVWWPGRICTVPDGTKVVITSGVDVSSGAVVIVVVRASAVGVGAARIGLYVCGSGVAVPFGVQP